MEVGLGAGRRVTSLGQLEILIEVMEANKELALGRVRSKEARAQSLRLWSACARKLNAEGVQRSAKEWSKVWNDYKCKVRTKLMQRRRGYANGGSNAILTPLEERVASIIGRELRASVRKDPIEVNIMDSDTKNGILQNDLSRDSLSVSVQSFNASSEESNDGVEVNIQHLSPSPLDESYEVNSPTELHPLPKTEQPRYRMERRRKIRRHTQSDHSRETPEFREAWAFINHIEEQRARTEQMQASANLKQAEAALKTAEATQSFAQSLKLIAKNVHDLVFANFADPRIEETKADIEKNRRTY